VFHPFRFPHYFSTKISREIDELYISTAISNFAQAVVMVFEPIFLYAVLGFSIPQVLWFFAAVYLGYIIFIPFGAKIISLYGYEHGILFSIPFQILFWFFLFGAQDTREFIYIAPLLFALQKSLYWPAFHASIARFARVGQVGREFSMLKVLINIAAVAGPIIGGIVSERLGVRMLFVLASVIHLISFIPLFTTLEKFTPKLYQFRDTLHLYKTAFKKSLGYMGFGEELLLLVIWPIFMYIALKDYQSIGQLVTIAAFCATGIILVSGKLTDTWSKIKLLRLGTVLYFFVWLSRMFAHGLYGVGVVDALSRTTKDMVFVPISAVTYERAESSHIMPYVVFFEQSLSIGKLAACLLGIILFTITGSFIALFILAALFTLLYLLL
jgi:MFS family permease